MKPFIASAGILSAVLIALAPALAVTVSSDAATSANTAIKADTELKTGTAALAASRQLVADVTVQQVTSTDASLSASATDIGASLGYGYQPLTEDGRVSLRGTESLAAPALQARAGSLSLSRALEAPISEPQVATGDVLAFDAADGNLGRTYDGLSGAVDVRTVAFDGADETGDASILRTMAPVPAVGLLFGGVFVLATGLMRRHRMRREYGLPTDV